MEPRKVAGGRGWSWIADGFRLFVKSPAMWVALLLILFALSRLLAIVPVMAAIFVLLIPVFLAGLMEGARAVEQGQELKIMHLACGFQKNAAQLVTLGGISLVGNLIAVMIVIVMSGDALNDMSKLLTATQITEDMRLAMTKVARAFLVATLVSMPLLMALWYAPLLVYFDDAKPLAAMKSSFVACLRNAMPLLVYGLIVFVGMFVAMPIAKLVGQADLALWLLAPVLVPSIYASYKDVYAAA